MVKCYRPNLSGGLAKLHLRPVYWENDKHTINSALQFRRQNCLNLLDMMFSPVEMGHGKWKIVPQTF